MSSTRARVRLLPFAIALSACSNSAPAPVANEPTLLASGAAPLEELRGFAPFAAVARGASLTRDGAGFHLAGTKLPGEFEVVVPSGATAPVRMTSPRDRDAWIDVAPLDVAPVVGEAQEGAVVFRAVAPDVDLVDVLAHDHFEELRLLRTNKASTVARYRVRLGAALVTLRAREGHVEAVDATGYVHLASAPMFAVDAHGSRREVAVRVERAGEDWFFETSFDPSGLSYPIAVDPLWSPQASMATERQRHASVMMSNGYVLAAGGTNASGAFLNSAERYNPATNTWSTAGTFTGARADATMTLLESTGRVLLAGGIDSTGIPYLATAVRYDPVANSWSAAGSAGNGLFGHTATYLPTVGRVLVAGGYAANRRAYLYTVSTNSWTAVSGVPDMAVGRQRHNAGLLSINGHALVFGGQTSGSGFTNTTEEFTPNATMPTGTWTTRGNLTTARQNAEAVAVSPREILVVGGGDGGGAISTAELYLATINAWGAAGTMTAARSSPGIAFLSGPNKVLLAGGSGSTSLSSAELFDVATKTFAAITPMPGVRVAHTMVALNATTALVVGGGTSSAAAGTMATTVKYSPPTLGMACASAADCPGLGGCVDGVCCNTACAGACQACSAAKKGSGTDGTCGPIANGTDPDVECPGQTCSGATLTNRQVCNGAGACRTNGTTPCTAGYLCKDATTCNTTCSGDAQCATTHHCSGTSCVADGTNGAACTSSAQCTSGFCVDGFCCNSDCLGPCRACSAAKKGSGSNGTCEVIGADRDPDNECPIDPGYPTSCGRDGFCDGAGSCRLFAKPSTSCGPTTCTAATVTGSLCNGSGTCTPGATPVACAPYGCSGTACATTCAADTDCAMNAFCTSANTCDVKRANGAACAAAKECTSNSCVDGVCCNTDCAAQCAACDVPGKVGTCVPVTGKPHGARTACAGEGTACGGSCDGVTAVACYYPLPTTACGGACTDGKQTKNACDGKGACVENSSTSCGAYTCGDAACRETCTTDAECATGYRCSESACIPAGGSTCIDATTAKSGDTVTPCAPFACESGACAKVCQTSASCAPGNICNSATKVCEPPAAGDTEDSGGCSTGRAGGSSGAEYALLATALAVVVAARRRRAAR